MAGIRPPVLGARAALMAASAWLAVATVAATAIAPADWKTRVVTVGAVSLFPGGFAFWPSPASAWLAAALWTIPGVLTLGLNGLGIVWLVAAVLAFTGGLMESHRRRHWQGAAR